MRAPHPARHIAGDLGCARIECAIVEYDIRDNDFLAICEQFLGQMATDEAVAAENDMFHREISLVTGVTGSMAAVSSVCALCSPLPDWAIRTVPTQMKAMPAMRQALRSSWKTK